MACKHFQNARSLQAALKLPFASPKRKEQKMTEREVNETHRNGGEEVGDK